MKRIVLYNFLCVKEEEDCPGSIFAVTPDPTVIILFLPSGVLGSVLSSLHILIN